MTHCPKHEPCPLYFYCLSLFFIGNGNSRNASSPRFLLIDDICNTTYVTISTRISSLRNTSTSSYHFRSKILLNYGLESERLIFFSSSIPSSYKIRLVSMCYFLPYLLTKTSYLLFQSLWLPSLLLPRISGTITRIWSDTPTTPR